MSVCDEFGIRHQFSAKYTPQSNGLVERKNRALIDMARSMLSEYNVSHSFLNDRKPNITYFRGFGCKCYILKKCTRLNKFEKKCDEGFLIGYSTTSKAYRV